jgi:hypothetical protein
VLLCLLPALPLVPALVAGWRARAPGAVRAGRALLGPVPALRCARPGAGRVWRGAAVRVVRLVRSGFARAGPVALDHRPHSRARAALALLVRSAPTPPQP